MRKRIIGIVCVASLLLMAGCGGSSAGGSSAASKASGATSSAAVSSAASSAASSVASSAASSVASSAASSAAASTEPSGGAVGMINPWVECGTLTDAAKISGFTLEVPEKLNGHPISLIQAVQLKTMQVFYSDGAPGTAGVKKNIIRKGVGSDDISGDYTKYEKTETMNIEGLDVQLKSNNNVYYNVTWVNGRFSYAIMSEDGIGMAQVKALVSTVK
ncbi:MAG: hypothetical protein IK054_02640 [Lachnospiraceae bacterium]|nr:hypothetical protein [Lachnospiraceae bacterium]